MSLDIDHRILRRYERELRRIAEHRKSYAERNIKAICEELMKDLQAFIAIEYAGNADDDDRLTFDTLYGKGRYARFLEEAEQHINSFAPEIQTEIQSLVQDTYTEMYGGMVTAVEGAATTGALATELAAVKAVQPEVLKRVVMNPISGLTLPDRLEKNRREIIYNIKQNIGTGLSLGDRYSTIAKRISDSCNFSYTKAIRIVRTESNRVREAGLNDCAREIDAAVRNGSSGLIGVKIWRTMKDERVRPQRRVKTKKGWKTYNYGGPNHMRMEGKIVKTDELFDLGDGVKTTAPGQSGVAGHDINCRCFIEHDWLTAEEYAAAVKKQGDKTVDKSAESGIMSVSNNTVALENQRYGRNKETLINNTYINSGEYRRKFDKLTPNPKVNRVLYSKSKEMLKHRSGTLFEDMYWIDGDTGKVIAREINSNVERQIVYSNSIRKTIASYSGKNILTIHTHPGSMPPSAADFNSCYKNKYACGYIACHNGKLYAYKSEEIISKSLYDMYTKEAILDGQSDIEAQIWAIHKLSQNHKIDFWEVV